MTAQFHLEHLNTEAIQVPADVAALLRSEAKKSKLSIPELLMQWIEDQADARDSAAVMKRIKDGKEKTAPWSEARKRLMAAP